MNEMTGIWIKVAPPPLARVLQAEFNRQVVNEAFHRLSVRFTDKPVAVLRTPFGNKAVCWCHLPEPIKMAFAADEGLDLIELN